VYHLLRYLKEPDWRSLHIDEAAEFWEKYEAWESLIEIAQMSQRPGDILVLADEVPISFLRIEAYRTAGKALLKLGRFSLALEQTEKALDIDPDDIESCQLKGILLERLKKLDASKEWLKATIKKHPESAETWSLLGHVEKDAWVNSWRGENKTSEEMRMVADDEESLLREAIDCYIRGFLLNPGHYKSGINAITLSHLHRHLTKKNEQAEMRKALEGGVCWAVKSALAKETPDSKDFSARVTLGDLEVLMSDTPVVEKAYKHAIAATEKDWFALDSSRQQLLMLCQLGFRLDQVSAAIKIFDLEIEKLKAPEARWEPRMIFLFSGHMIDAPGRAEPRFPPDQESIAADAIAAKLDELGAGKGDLALCGGACGGDLLFAEACLQRGVRLELRIPFDEPTFLIKSVTFAGDLWRDRFYKVKNHQDTHLYIMPDEIGISPPKVNPYTRNNLWQLYTALACGPEKVRFICLWNRKEGDGPGGTKHMYPRFPLPRNELGNTGLYIF
jgi:tetratricopeptide (TPR) repeat protein